MERTASLPPLLEVAIERKYLDRALAERVAQVAEKGRMPIERALAEAGGLSSRRVTRLVNHLRYKTLRKADKGYCRAAVKAGVIDEPTAKAALDTQRELFEGKRECTRVGAILIERKLITDRQDRMIRSKLSSSGSSPGSDSASAATFLDSSVGQTSGSKSSGTSYQAIDSAMARVESVKRAREDISTSVENSEAPSRDSAAEFENAIVMLARRRVGASASGSGASGTGAVA